MPAYSPFINKNAKQITAISLAAMVLGHLMIALYVPNVVLNIVGLLMTSFFIYYYTLRSNDLFSFVMVIYFCSFFPYLSARGGGFNLVVFVCIGLYLIFQKKFPSEILIKDKWFKLLLGVFILTSCLGWIFNFTGNISDFVYSFSSFFGLVFIILISGSLLINYQRIKVFLQLNIVLIIYATIASLNKYLHLIPFDTPMMPVVGGTRGPFHGGGTLGISPYYGEYSMILMILFLSFFLLSKKPALRKTILFLAALLSMVNVFMSISRSVFLLSLAGILVVFIFQLKLNSISLQKQVFQIIVIFFLGASIMLIVKRFGLDFVLSRLDQIEQSNRSAGGVTVERILNGSAFNRDVAFAVAKERYESKESWLIGYGWGLAKNNRDAFYVDPEVSRTTPHSQIFAILFLFGWIGLIAYYSLIFRIMNKSFRIIGNGKIDYTQRMFAFFFFIAFGLFVINEIKVDSIYSPSYFAVTIIWMGLAYALNNSLDVQKMPQEIFSGIK